MDLINISDYLTIFYIITEGMSMLVNRFTILHLQLCVSAALAAAKQIDLFHIFSKNDAVIDNYSRYRVSVNQV